MNRCLLILACLFSFSSFTFAGFNLPKYCLTHDQLAEAKEQATKDKKPIAYLLSNTNSNCGSSCGASEAFLKAMGKNCVVIYLNVKKMGEEIKKLDPKIKRALYKGETYPILVIASPDDNKILGHFTCSAYGGDPKATIRNIKKTIQDFKKENK